MNHAEGKKIKLSNAEEYILTVLHNRELYGLELLHEINRRLDLLDRFSHNKLYGALNRLKKKKLISWRWSDDGEKTSGAKRKYYTVSDLGIKILRELHSHQVSRYFPKLSADSIN